MNRVLLNREDNINNLVIEEDTILDIDLIDIDKKINIIVENDILLKVNEISKNSSNNLNCILKNNSKVLYTKLGLNCSDNYTFQLEGDNSSIEFINDIINIDDLECNIMVNHKNKNTSSYVYNKGINYSKDNLNIAVDINIDKNSLYSNSNQINKVININGGKSFVLPNLIVDNKEVNASHSCYIGDFDKESVFYLKTRGLNDNETKRLLIEGLLLDKIEDNDLKEKIINCIHEWR